MGTLEEVKAPRYNQRMVLHNALTSVQGEIDMEEDRKTLAGPTWTDGEEYALAELYTARNIIKRRQMWLNYANS